MLRKDLRDVHAALAVLAERERARHQRPGIALPDDDVAFAGQRLAGVFVSAGLGSKVSNG